MPIKNLYKLEVDIKRQFTSEIVTFTEGDTNEIVITVLDNTEEFDISSVSEVDAYYRNRNGHVEVLDCNIGKLNTKNVIIVDLSNVKASESSELLILLKSKNTQLTLPEIKVVIRKSKINELLAIHTKEPVISKDDVDKLKNSNLNVELYFNYDKGLDEIINTISKSFIIK